MTRTGEKTSRAEIGPVLTFMNVPVSKIHPLNDTTQLIFYLLGVYIMKAVSLESLLGQV